MTSLHDGRFAVNPATAKFVRASTNGNIASKPSLPRSVRPFPSSGPMVTLPPDLFDLVAPEAKGGAFRPAVVKVAAFLAREADRWRWAGVWKSMRTIARALKVSVRTVQDALKAL